MRWELASTVAVLAMSAACYGPSTVECDNGFLCPEGFACAAPGYCGRAPQVAACAGEDKSDYQSCDDPAGGTCRNGICEPCTLERAGCPTDGFVGMAKPAEDDLHAVWVARRDLAFAVGEGGATWRYDGWSWSKLASAGVDLHGVWGADEANIYAAAVDGRIFKWNGAAWDEVAATELLLTAIAGTSPTHVVAVGLGGMVAELTSSGEWQVSQASADMPLSLDAIAAAGDDLYAAGGGGGILRKDAAGWTVVRAPDPANEPPLAAIWVGGPDDIVVAGPDETLLQGPTWTAIDLPGILPGTVSFHGASGAGGDVFVVGDGGTVVRRSGDQWIQITPSDLPPQARLRAISGADGVVMVVGDAGTVWRYAPRP